MPGQLLYAWHSMTVKVSKHTGGVKTWTTAPWQSWRWRRGLNKRNTPGTAEVGAPKWDIPFMKEGDHLAQHGPCDFKIYLNTLLNTKCKFENSFIYKLSILTKSIIWLFIKLFTPPCWWCFLLGVACGSDCCPPLSSGADVCWTAWPSVCLINQSELSLGMPSSGMVQQVVWRDFVWCFGEEVGLVFSSDRLWRMETITILDWRSLGFTFSTIWCDMFVSTLPFVFLSFLT